MVTIQQVSDFLAEHAPPILAEDWDNVGLLVGDAARSVERVMTCLTVTPATVGEAIDERVQLLVAHHPLPFRPLKQLTTQTLPGRMLLQLIEAGVAVHSSHTAFDSSADGINHALAEGLGLVDVRPLILARDSPTVGAGRFGQLPNSTSLSEMAQRLKKFLKIESLQQVGDAKQIIHRVAVACGSAGQFLSAARNMRCDLLITGETSFHTCVEADAMGVSLLLPGHYASERFGMEKLAGTLAAMFPDCEVWPSRKESDPLSWV
jgi:dinuclear metal center YbgI/SA1388 family protein